MQSKLSRARWAVFFTALIFAVAPHAVAGPQSTPMLHADTRVVEIDVVATDAHGKPVTDLTKTDFTIVDQGKSRAIDIFAVDRHDGIDHGQTSPPVGSQPQSLSPNVFSNRNPRPVNNPGHATVLVLDQVNAYVEDAAYARQQVIDLMKRVPADERIALYTIARKEGLVLLQDYTTDRELLLRSLRQYAPHGLSPSPPPPPTRENRSGNTSAVGNAAALANDWAKGSDQPSAPGLPNELPPPGIREQLFMWEENSAGTRLSLQALAEHLAIVPGRKSIFWITQGFPPWLMKEVGMWTPPAMDTAAWNKTITALNEANVAVNTVDSRGNFRGGNPNTGTLDTMQEISGRTGGTAYFRRNDLDVAIEEGIEASRTTYTLGFYLNATDRDDKFHTLKVLAARRGLQLSYRQGYYAGNTEMPDSAKDRSAGSDLESALLNQADSKDVGITARIDSIVPGTPRGTVTFRVSLDPATFSLTEQAGGWIGNVEEMVVERDENGAVLAKVSDTKAFEVSTANRARFDSDGVAWPLSIPLAEGAAKATIVVRDAKSGRVGSLTVPLK